MKKFAWMALLMLGFGMGASLYAQDAAATAAAQEENYESLMITIWEDSPEYQLNVPTYGAKIGILGCAGAPVYGAEGAVISASSEKVCGFKGALAYTAGKEIEGCALAPVNLVDDVHGVGIAVVNVAKKGGIQIGILNFMENGFLPCFPLVNFSL